MNHAVERYPGELNTLREKVETYESVLHTIQLYRAVTLDEPALIHLLDFICEWSYAHRRGNGEIDNDALVKSYFEKMKEAPWRESVWNSQVDTAWKIKHRKRAQEALK
jgi:hypothetical protein